MRSKSDMQATNCNMLRHTFLGKVEKSIAYVCYSEARFIFYKNKDESYCGHFPRIAQNSLTDTGKCV